MKNLTITRADVLSDGTIRGTMRYGQYEFVEFVTTPILSQFTMVDSYSDGMCGWVIMRNNHTMETQRVGWSVTGKIDSQHAAMDEAKRRLTQELTA